MYKPQIMFSFLVLALTACNGEIYLRDGVTDGDSFYLSTQAAGNPDPAVQSWVRYSLAKSVCQLNLGTGNPARSNSFDCERTARRHLLEAWQEERERNPALADAYLDELQSVHQAGYLDEYVAHYFGESSWTLPGDLGMDEFRQWRRRAIAGHRPETRIIGYWGYENTASSQ